MSKNISLFTDFLIKTIQCLLLDVAHQEGTVFAATVRVDFDDYHSEIEKRSVGGFIHVAVPYTSGGYKRVYAAFTDRPQSFPSVEWQLVCSHDSAWRDDGVRASVRSGFNAIKVAALDYFKIDYSQLTESVQIDTMAIAPLSVVFGDVDPRQLALSRFSPVSSEIEN